jgi:hypothetical protein
MIAIFATGCLGVAAALLAWLVGYFHGYRHGYEYARMLGGNNLPAYDRLHEEMP